VINGWYQTGDGGVLRGGVLEVCKRRLAPVAVRP